MDRWKTFDSAAILISCAFLNIRHVSRLRLFFAIQFLASLLRSEGASENSP
jgi:hypothetical protein